MLTDEYRYLAGWLDGEGLFAIYRRPEKGILEYLDNGWRRPDE